MRSEHVPSVVDAQHGHHALVVVDAVQNLVRAAACAVNSSELVAQLSPDATRVVEQRAGDELDDGRSNDLGQVLADRPSRWSCNDEFVGAIGH